MTNWKKYALAAVIVIAAGFIYIKNSHKDIPQDHAAIAENVKSLNLNAAIAAVKKDDVDIPAVKTAGDNPSAGAPAKPVEWITINGGKFTMGAAADKPGFEDAKPTHEVAIKTFDMSRTAVTVEQYAECVTKGKCTEPVTGDDCNWEVPGRQLYPVNCVDWSQANQYAKFKSARLPSESEWEYAATSGGKSQKYPWGNDEPTCNKAVMYGNGGYGCGKNSTWPVCSKTAGNTAQGLCDMAGNVWQWVQDQYRDSYNNAPADGSAYEGPEGTNSDRIIRGGSFKYGFGRYLWISYRACYNPGGHDVNVGFRIVRSSH